ncbi:carbohydrate ABC transporter permease [Haploplasma axanthum]|uniref:Inner membrane ABC transporter permease protein ycjP n=1 Tax=Haploplasma axanthum TaxID=29552 RepID=A0A449BE65_HAPAX|nr:carbohydrate ABC transporter permease [Haploplasma axanthum]VEU80722.1 Inner membrane ABC transporter permease protein ycjP [Haploplasma axanthum]
MIKKDHKQKFKRVLFGMNFVDGLFYKTMIYILLISFSYIYLYPLLYMLTNSFMGSADLVNDGVKWIPTKLNFSNYKQAWQVLDIAKSFFGTTGYVLKVSLLSTISSALIGYGFARFDFPFKKLLFILMLATFILPNQVTMSSNLLILRKLGLIGSQSAMTYPALFGQGINSAIFILIFYQFFKTIPSVLMESAEVDGAGEFKIFYKIAIPLAIPSIIIVFLFSFVWYWNETYLTGLYTGTQLTLPLKLMSFRSTYETLFPPGSAGAALNEGVVLAGNMLVILPLLVLYFLGQKHFTESIDRTGITGE